MQNPEFSLGIFVSLIFQIISMAEPRLFYQSNVQELGAKIQSLEKRLRNYSILRITVFLVTAVALYFTFSNIILAIFLGIIGLGIFLFLLSKYTDFKKSYQLNNALLNINSLELRVLDRNFHDLPDGSKYKDPDHAYCEDIDLFGKGSFFQYLNRTGIDSGSDLLAQTLLANDPENIIGRQEAIKELSVKPEWNQKFEAYADLVIIKTPSKKIENWLISYQPVIKPAFKWLPLIFSIGTVMVGILTYLDIISLRIFGYWFFLGLIITGRFLKKTNELSKTADDARDTINQFSTLMKLIEDETFDSQILKEQQSKLLHSGFKSSQRFKKFASALNALDNRNNLIYGLFANGFFLADLYNTIRVENWIIENKNLIPDWFQTVAFFDAQISLSTFAFNHPNYSYPVISNSKEVINAKDLGHPLLNPHKRIDNDIKIENEEFFIITGANMAGKSTFLRTVSLFVVMANVGLPVCSSMSNYNPIKLITSMRTSDSLKDESSYFFAELSRLKFIVDKIKTEPYFIILDEILKGTNSTDKAIGSKKFVEKLVKGNATGLIATHDLSLCEIANDLQDVENYYFDAEIINDELYFDYKFKKGICKNMNASFLLKKMEII